MVLTKIGNGLSGLLGAGIIVIGARFLVAPGAAARLSRPPWNFSDDGPGVIVT